HYGDLSLKSIEDLVKKEFRDEEFTFFQSNIEGEIVNCIQDSKDKYTGIIINPGGYAHTSVAIRDALADIKLPKIEVHLSHLVNREEFRQTLLTAGACNGYLSGFKQHGYTAAVYLLKRICELPN
ncbi:MAG: type II 3-dehydroquinate dehydratase, partial [Ignavibacteriaceae bacterium]